MNRIQIPHSEDSDKKLLFDHLPTSKELNFNTIISPDEKLTKIGLDQFEDPPLIGTLGGDEIGFHELEKLYSNSEKE